VSAVAEWLSRISLSCFAFSYLLTLILEISRLFFRVAVRWAIMLLVMALGLFAHIVYIGLRIRASLVEQSVPLGDWHTWCVVAALAIAVFYFALSIRRPQNNTGLFLLPLVLALTVTAALIKGSNIFPDNDASLWGMMHGLSLLAGTVTMALGFATGIMYLVQSHRLKKKLTPRRGMRLPSLEWLQRMSSRCLSLSTILLAIGLFSGIFMNIIRQLPLDGGVVFSSSILLCWLIAVMVFEYFYKPARQGRKVAYLTVASFVFLALVLVVVILGGHAAAGSTASLELFPFMLMTWVVMP
jgi:hypothetical protein